MTVEALPAQLAYPVNGTGPYVVQFGFTDPAHVRLWVENPDGSAAPVPPEDWTLTPVGPVRGGWTGGTITLTAEAAAELDGQTIRPERDTTVEQGWEGVTRREQGLEAQLDWTVRAVQDHGARSATTLRAFMGTNALNPFIPLPGRVLMFNDDGQPTMGPAATQIAGALAAAEAALQAAADVDQAQQAIEAARDVVLATTAQTFADLPALLAYTGADFPVGSILRTAKEGFPYERVASGGDLVVSGMHLQALPIAGEYLDAQFGTGALTVSQLQAAVNRAAGRKLVLTRSHTWDSVVTGLAVSGLGTVIEGREADAGITYTTPGLQAIILSGARCALQGFRLTAPASWDGINTQPLYGGIWITGFQCEVSGMRLDGVVKAGVRISNSNDHRIFNNNIVGNFPEATYIADTNQTNHSAVVVDTTGTGTQGNIAIYGNSISRCVQGVLIANYGSSSRSQGIRVFGNGFENCWDHGVYSAGFDFGIAVNGNTFVRCRIPVAATGDNHAIIGNILTIGGLSGTIIEHTGISLRGPQNCVVANNVIDGEALAGGVIIDLNVPPGVGTVVAGNVIEGNTINLRNTNGCMAIRVGTTAATEIRENIVTGNRIRGAVSTNNGMITVSNAPGGVVYGNRVDGNQITLTGAGANSGFIAFLGTRGASASNNSMRIEFNAGSAIVIAGVLLSACIGCDVRGNIYDCPATVGTNITLRGVWQLGAADNNSSRHHNRDLIDTTLLTFVPYVISGGTNLLIEDSGPGAPTVASRNGSTWLRTDGAVGTTRYVRIGGAWLPNGVQSATATYDPPSIASGSQEVTTVTLTGAAVGDRVLARFSQNLQGLILTAHVSAANTVTCVFANLTGGAVDLASGTLTVERF